MKPSLKPGALHVGAHDEVDVIGECRHERFVVTWDKFNASVDDKAATAEIVA